MIKCVVEFLLEENNIKDKEQFTHSLAEATEYLHSNGIIIDFHVREYLVVDEIRPPKPMSKLDLIAALRRTIKEHNVSSTWIESFKGKGYDDKMDNWVNVYYVEEWLNYAAKNDSVERNEAEP
jgi:hypothetical protein